MISSLIFLVITVFSIGLFVWQIQKIRRNINLGRDKIISGNKGDLVNKLLLVAFGQQKMFKRPLPAILHGIVYVGFLVINIEVLEIIIDGIFGTHRALSFLGPV
ncbi:MAG: Fe-S oxidoreductase, partial [Bacteroidota bacterium]|nr:Fe-S oxidoreductase [Bacteroidota bacterium]